jgi:AcrR family transcriptional regulator
VPKRVDHEQRRQQIADAVCRLLGRDGLEAVSLREVAAEAGVSMGRIQHYFSTRDEMLMFTFRVVAARIDERVRAALDKDTGRPPTTRDVVRSMLVAMLPLGEQGRLEAPVWVAFLGKAVVDPRFAAPLREDVPRLTDFIAGHIQAARRARQPAAGVNATREARMLLALVDGLMLHLLVGQLDEQAALTTLDHQLDRILPAPSQRSCTSH